MKHRDAAQKAAIEAMQEASVAESLLRCLRYPAPFYLMSEKTLFADYVYLFYNRTYSELCSCANEDDPQPAIEQFLTLQSNLITARTVADSLSKTIPFGSSPDTEGNKPSEEEVRIVSERRKQATSWVHAALATNLSTFSVYTKDISSTSNQQQSVIKPVVVLKSSDQNATTQTSVHQDKARPSISSRTATPGASRRLSNGLTSTQKPIAPPPPPPPIDWSYGNGLDSTIDLTEMLQTECQEWFLKFLEKFMDADINTSALSNNGQIAGMLTQLKSVNTWLDTISSQDNDAISEASTISNSNIPANTIDRLRKKIYEYLLTHVESAAAAVAIAPLSSRTASDIKTRR